MNEIPQTAAAVAGNGPLDPFDELPVPYIEIDARGVVTRANRAALALYPPEHGEMVGSVVWDAMAEDEKQISRSTFHACMESGEEPPVVRRSFYTSRDEFRVFELHRRLIRDADGRPKGIRIVSFDVTEAQIAHEEAHQARQWLESVLASVSEAVVVCDVLGFIRYLNPAAEQLSGWKAAELIGKVIEKGFPLLSYISGESRTLSHRVALEKRTQGIATVLDRERRALRVEITTSPILDRENGFTAGVVGVLRRIESALD